MKDHQRQQLHRQVTMAQEALASYLEQLHHYPSVPGPEQKAANVSLRVRAEHVAKKCQHLSKLTSLHTEPTTASAFPRMAPMGGAE